VVVVDRLIDAVHVDLAAAVLVDHGANGIDELGQASLVVRGDPILRGLTLMLDTQTDNTIGEPLNLLLVSP